MFVSVANDRAASRHSNRVRFYLNTDGPVFGSQSLPYRLFQLILSDLLDVKSKVSYNASVKLLATSDDCFINPLYYVSRVGNIRKSKI